MNYYYYLVASLPSISFDTPPPRSTQQFLDDCRQHLSDADLQGMNELFTPDKEVFTHPFSKDWDRLERSLRNALTRIRASRLGIDPTPHLRPDDNPDPTLDKVAADAFARDNPRDRELFLDKFRWGRLEDLAGSDPFSARALLAYGKKLSIAERWAEMDEEKGKAAVDDAVRQQPNNDEGPESE